MRARRSASVNAYSLRKRAGSVPAGTKRMDGAAVRHPPAHTSATRTQTAVARRIGRLSTFQDGVTGYGSVSKSLSDERRQASLTRGGRLSSGGAGIVAAAIAILAVKRFVQFSGMLTESFPEDSRAALGTADPSCQEHGAPNRQRHTDWVTHINRDRVVDSGRDDHYEGADDNTDQGRPKWHELSRSRNQRIVHAWCIGSGRYDLRPGQIRSR